MVIDMNTFSRTERVIYEYILCNAHKLSDISAKTIAIQTFTTTTSVNRVCKKMGYSGYTELRYKHDHQSTSRITSTEKNFEIEEKKSHEICQELNSGQHVYLYARGATLTSLNYLSRFLSIAGIPHLILIDIHQLALINKGILLLVSKSGETKDILDMARNAKRNHIRVIAITHKDSTLAKIASHTWSIEMATNTSSIYKRETQIKLLAFIDDIGCKLLETPDI